MTAGRIRTVDYHTGGEPFRIVPDPPVAIAGATVAERRVIASTDPNVDGLRRLLCFEPRGHADMYGGFVVPPDDDGAHLGVLFWHKDGFSTACGHGTIALAVWAVRSGLVPLRHDWPTFVVIDVPSGRVTSRVRHTGDRVWAVDFVNVPSYVISTRTLVTTSRGQVAAEVAYGGAIYASVPAAAVGLEVTPRCLPELIAVGREIKWALNDSDLARHPSDPRLNGVYGTIFHEDVADDVQGDVHQRNVTIFADGEVDRSPCGSGTSARLALLTASGRLQPGHLLVHESIVGSQFTGQVIAERDADGRSAVVTQITGMAHPTGEHLFEVDPDDPLVPGFVFR